MDKENLKGAAQKAKGQVEEVAGKIFSTTRGLSSRGKPTSSEASCGMQLEVGRMR